MRTHKISNEVYRSDFFEVIFLDVDGSERTQKFDITTAPKQIARFGMRLPGRINSYVVRRFKLISYRDDEGQPQHVRELFSTQKRCFIDGRRSTVIQVIQGSYLDTDRLRTMLAMKLDPDQPLIIDRFGNVGIFDDEQHSWISTAEV